MVNGSALKWLERMEGLLRWRKPRFIGVMVDGTKPFDEEAMAELLKSFDVQPQAVCLRRRTTARLSYNLKGDCHEFEDIKRNPTLREGQPLIAEQPDPHRPHGHAVAQ
jgi:hypothetical protein